MRSTVVLAKKFDPAEVLVCPKCGHKGGMYVPDWQSYDMVDMRAWRVGWCPKVEPNDEFGRHESPEQIKLACPRCSYTVGRLPQDAVTEK